MPPVRVRDSNTLTSNLMLLLLFVRNARAVAKPAAPAPIMATCLVSELSWLIIRMDDRENGDLFIRSICGTNALVRRIDAVKRVVETTSAFIVG